ncbi:hypothetical protein BH24ACT12_BH24ACT12_24490 [soil metagenome]
MVANGGRGDVSCWGGLLSLGASRRGIRGVIVDGACRDVDEARASSGSRSSPGPPPPYGTGRLRQVTAGEPVRVGEVSVCPGDVVLVDETGVAVVPCDHAEEVLSAAQRLVGREQAIAAQLRAGSSLPEAMRDARLAGTEEVS